MSGRGSHIAAFGVEPVTFSIPNDLVQNLQEHQAFTGERRSALICRLLREHFTQAGAR